MRCTCVDGDTLGTILTAERASSRNDLLQIIERTCKSELRSDPGWQRKEQQRDNAMTKPDPFSRLAAIERDTFASTVSGLIREVFAFVRSMVIFRFAVCTILDSRSL